MVRRSSYMFPLREGAAKREWLIGQSGTCIPKLLTWHPPSCLAREQKNMFRGSGMKLKVFWGWLLRCVRKQSVVLQALGKTGRRAGKRRQWSHREPCLLSPASHAVISGYFYCLGLYVWVFFFFN